MELPAPVREEIDETFTMAPRPGAFPVLTVHDEIVIEAPADRAEEAKKWLVQCMTDGMSQVLKEVPVVVEAEVNNTWG